RRRKERLERILPYLETVCVLATLFWTGWELLGDHPPYFLVLVVGIVLTLLWAIRFALYDIAAGIVLRSENLYQPGDAIVIDSINSEVDKVGYRSLTVTQIDGKRVKIPYSYLSRLPLVTSTSSNTIQSHSFKISLPADKNVPDAVNRLRLLVMTSPWSVATALPGIKLMEKSADMSVFQITVFALETSRFPEIESYVRESIDFKSSD
ncbi:mechanosensitive ion channel, partial [bacterium]|nr:mechanosensitive ion channel [bacterium]